MGVWEMGVWEMGVWEMGRKRPREQEWEQECNHLEHRTVPC